MNNWYFFHVRLNSDQVTLFSCQNSPYFKRYIAIPWEQATSPTSEDDDRSIKGEKEAAIYGHTIVVVRLIKNKDEGRKIAWYYAKNKY